MPLDPWSLKNENKDKKQSFVSKNGKIVVLAQEIRKEDFLGSKQMQNRYNLIRKKQLP